MSKTGTQPTLYDFRIPKKFTKDDIKTINKITDAFSKLLTSGLTSMTREPCSVYNPRINELTGSAYLDSLPKNTMLGTLSFDIPKYELRDSEVLFNIPSEFGFFLIDILLGGSGKEYTVDRQHTDIEVAILKNLITRFSSYLEEAWKQVAEVNFRYEKSETNPILIDVKSPGDVKLIMYFDVSLKNINTSISIAFSTQVIEDLMSKLGNSHTDDSINDNVDEEKNDKRRENILEALGETSIELKAVLAELTVDMHEIMSLREGDIIPLDKKISEDITITVDDTPWFKGKLGQVNIKKAVKITESLHEY